MVANRPCSLTTHPLPPPSDTRSSPANLTSYCVSQARPKGSERRKQRLHSIATASSDPIHPSAEQTQPIPSESSFEFSSPFPTTRCSGSSASSASSSSSSSTAAEAEAEVEFERDDLEITKRRQVAPSDPFSSSSCWCLLTLE